MAWHCLGSTSFPEQIRTAPAALPAAGMTSVAEARGLVRCRAARKTLLCSIWEDALKAAQEAADLTRELTGKNPDAFQPNLAMSLGSLGKAFTTGESAAERRGLVGIDRGFPAQFSSGAGPPQSLHPRWHRSHDAGWRKLLHLGHFNTYSTNKSPTRTCLAAFCDLVQLVQSSSVAIFLNSLSEASSPNLAAQPRSERATRP